MKAASVAFGAALIAGLTLVGYQWVQGGDHIQADLEL